MLSYLLTPLYPKEAFLVPSVAPKFLSNPLKIITHAFQGTDHLMISIILELPLPFDTNHSLLQKLYLLGHCSTAENIFSFFLVFSYLSTPLHYWPLSASALLLTAVLSKGPPLLIFSLRNLTHHFYSGNTQICIFMLGHSAEYLGSVHLNTSRHPYMGTPDLPAWNGIHYLLDHPASQTSSPLYDPSLA